MLNRFLDFMARLFRIAAAFCLGVMLTINAVNIAWRALTDQAFDWVFSWTMLLFVWMLFLGLFVYMRDRRDVVVDIIARRLPPPLRLVVGVGGCLTGLTVMLLVLKAAPELMALQTGRMEAIALPIYLRALPLFISAAFVSLHFAGYAVELLSGRKAAFDRPAVAALTREGAPE